MKKLSVPKQNKKQTKNKQQNKTKQNKTKQNKKETKNRILHNVITWVNQLSAVDVEM